MTSDVQDRLPRADAKNRVTLRDKAPIDAGNAASTTNAADTPPIRPADELLDIAQQIVAQAQRAGAQGAEVFIKEQRSLQGNTKGGLTSTRANHADGIGLRILCDGTDGLAQHTGLDTLQVDQLIQRALTHAQDTPAPRRAPSLPMAEAPTAAPSPVDDTISAQDPDRLLALLNDAREHATDEHTTFNSITLQSSYSRYAIVNHHGIATWDQGSRESITFEIRRDHNGRSVTTWDASSDVIPIERQGTLDKIAGGVLQRAQRAEHVQSLPETRDHVVLGTGVSAQIFHTVLRGLSGRLYAAEQSPYQGQLDQPIASETIHLLDSVRHQGAPRVRVDHEGVPTADLPVIEAGVLRNIYHDHASAQAMDQASNARGLRSKGWNGRPAPAAIHPALINGTHSFDELIEGVTRGVYIPEPMTGMFTANVTTGDFSATVPYAFAIDHGQVSHAIPGATVGGNAHELLRNVEAVGREQGSRQYGTFAPLRCKGVTVASM